MPSDWTAAALSDDIPAGTAAPGQVAGMDLALWRSASGRIAAWADRCPHRGMRLSHGFVRGEALSCIYHGWRYSQDGHCMKIPAHPGLEPPDAIRVPTFAVREGSGVVWVAEAEPASEPPAFPGFVGFRTLRVAAPAAATAAALGGAGDVIGVTLGPVGVIILVQPLRGGDSALHILAPDGTPVEVLDMLSVAAEAARRDIETHAGEGRV